MILRIIKWYLKKHTNYVLVEKDFLDKLSKEVSDRIERNILQEIKRVEDFKRVYTIEQEPCNKCNTTIREQRKGCNEITCYRQHLQKDFIIQNPYLP